MDIFPLKNRIYVRLYGQLHTGKYLHGKMPPEQTFAHSLGVSRNTLRAALEMLENDGVLLRRKAVGTLAQVDKRSSFNGSLLFCMLEKRASPHVGDSIFRGAAAAAEARGIRADVCSIENLSKIPFEELRVTLEESCCKGIILHQRNFLGNEKIVQVVRSLGLPVVLAYCEKGDSEATGFAAVRHCGRESWLDALRYLVDSGHRRIVTLTLEKEVIRECFSPEEYAAYLTEMGLETALNPVLKCAMNDKAIYEKLTPLFQGRCVPDAILCYSDYWALPVYRVLKKMKLRIPQDISVMGYCGSVDADFISPKLTTVSIGYEETGHLAVKILSESPLWFNVSGNKSPEAVAPYMLKVRESTLQH